MSAKPNYERKQKLTVEMVDLKDQGENASLVGVYRGQTTRPWLEKSTGVEKPLTTVVFEDPNTGARSAMFQDAGLKNAMEQSLVKEGDFIEIVYLGKTDIGGGRTVNQYDIFALELPLSARTNSARPAPHAAASA